MVYSKTQVAGSHTLPLSDCRQTNLGFLMPAFYLLVQIAISRPNPRIRTSVLCVLYVVIYRPVSILSNVDNAMYTKHSEISREELCFSLIIYREFSKLQTYCTGLSFYLCQFESAIIVQSKINASCFKYNSIVFYILINGHHSAGGYPCSGCMSPDSRGTVFVSVKYFWSLMQQRSKFLH